MTNSLCHFRLFSSLWFMPVLIFLTSLIWITHLQFEVIDADGCMGGKLAPLPGSKWCHHRKMSLLLSEIFWLQFSTPGTSGDKSSTSVSVARTIQFNRQPCWCWCSTSRGQTFRGQSHTDLLSFSSIRNPDSFAYSSHIETDGSICRSDVLKYLLTRSLHYQPSPQVDW